MEITLLSKIDEPNGVALDKSFQGLRLVLGRTRCWPEVPQRQNLLAKRNGLVELGDVESTQLGVQIC